MRISVIVCTFNRSQTLRRTLLSLQEIIIPDHLSCEFIIVDNNSNDDTLRVFQEIKQRSDFDLVYMFEKRQGISYARNRGIKEAKGDIIAFTDDDVTVDRNWVKNIDKAFNEHNDVACVGGKLLPIWDAPRPKWIIPELYLYLGLLDYGDSFAYMDKPYLWGANLAIRSEMFREYGLFNENLGRIPEKLYSGEETEFLRRLMEAGENILYYPLMIIYHHVPVWRISKNYMRRWNFDNGELGAMRGGDTNHYRYSNYFYRMITISRRVILNILKMVCFCFSAKRFFYELKIWRYLGFLSGKMKRIFSKS